MIEFAFFASIIICASLWLLSFFIERTYFFFKDREVRLISKTEDVKEKIKIPKPIKSKLKPIKKEPLIRVEDLIDFPD